MVDPFAPSATDRSKELSLIVLIIGLAVAALVYSESRDLLLSNEVDLTTHQVTGFSSTNGSDGGIPFVHTVDKNGMEFSIRAERQVAQECSVGQKIQVEVRGPHVKLAPLACNTPKASHD